MPRHGSLVSGHGFADLIFLSYFCNFSLGVYKFVLGFGRENVFGVSKRERQVCEGDSA